MASKPKTGPSFLNYAKLALVGAASAAAGTSGAPAKPSVPRLGALPELGTPGYTGSSLSLPSYHSHPVGFNGSSSAGGAPGGALIYRPAVGSTAVNANAYRFNPTITAAPGARAAAAAPFAGFRYNLGVEKAAPYGIEENENAENVLNANARIAANARAKENANAKFLANARASFRNSFANGAPAAERGGRRSTKRSNRRRNNRSRKQKQQRRH